MHDVIVIGGGYAGMAAALQLARARRPVLVIDAGARRNRFAAAAHGFLSRDGESPGAIAEAAKAQLLAYPDAAWIAASATEAAGDLDGFTIGTADGRSYGARRLVLASGIADILPDLPGLAERWGRSVFHCPYCHGYELARGPLGVLATRPHAIDQAMLIDEWGPVTLFLQDAVEPDAEQAALLVSRGIRIERTPVSAVEGGKGIVLRLVDGRAVALAGLFVTPLAHWESPLPQQLGCDLAEGPFGPYIAVDAAMRTSVEGVYACGDAARASGALALAVADGTLAGMAAHHSLVFGTV